MKIVFFGTPDFAVPALAKIYDSDFSVEAVVTAPDKERGRGRKVSFTPVKEFGLDKGIKVLQPENLNDEQFVNSLQNIEADLFVVVAFRILPEAVFTIPSKGSFNLHGSLLPKYRGAAPIQWALINGENLTGVTTFFLKKKVDTGNILLQKKIDIKEDDNFGSLHDKMSSIGADLVLETILMIEKNTVIEYQQDNSLTSPAPKITKEICKIDWKKPAEDIHNLIRGLSPFPGAYFELKGKNYKVFNSSIRSDTDLKAGEIRESKKQIFIGTSKSVLEVLEIQPEGRKRMRTEEFLRGYSLI